jgi:hypothetical protein
MLKTKPTLSLEEQIKQIQAECDAFLDEKAAELKRRFEGLPLAMLRRDLALRSPGCQCRQALSILETK